MGGEWMEAKFLLLENPLDKKNPPLYTELADSFLRRFWGLMGRPGLPPGHGLLLSPCSSVHMCFMRFAIDVAYLDKEYRICKVVHCLRPWRGISWCPHAWAVLELPAGEAQRLGYRPGIKLQIVKSSGT